MEFLNAHVTNIQFIKNLKLQNVSYSYALIFSSFLWR